MSARPLIRLAVLAASLAALIGCGKNLPTSVIVPTGYRPGTPPGAISGSVSFDPAYPGLDVAPFPRVLAELHKYKVGGRGEQDSVGALVESRVLGGASTDFSFTGVMPGTYIIQFRADHAFRGVDRAPIFVELDPVRLSNIVLPAEIESLSIATYVVGTMPGFSLDDAFLNGTTSMTQDALGLWTYPDLLFGYTPIAAGTYRFKFVTDFSSTPGHLIGWGGDSTVTLTAPVTNAPVRYASGPAEDIKVTIPSTGNWSFTLDERRLTFSITPAPATAAIAARARTPR
ncbi:MAG: hypothetical protein HZA61_12190 [Candidatus Eisenbacteria bacterium]|uniref:Uncharacterized protein n=1 Tax=Eiseniibacteriota bacterium TaxID=2212470 RepID=A0A933SFA8_UNCEI|nr:hypothetical protein [Candidatus Eisenbacteria bacterium]